MRTWDDCDVMTQASILAFDQLSSFDEDSRAMMLAGVPR
jgi:hypothetical protein